MLEVSLVVLGESLVLLAVSARLVSLVALPPVSGRAEAGLGAAIR